MQESTKDAILLKNLIKLQFNTLGDLAKKLQIDLSTLSRKIKKPTRQFLIQLKDAGVPIPDHAINPIVNSVSAVITKDGLEGFIVKESNGEYNKDMHHKCREQLLKALQEIKELKAENYDLKKQLEGYKK